MTNFGLLCKLYCFVFLTKCSCSKGDRGHAWIPSNAMSTLHHKLFEWLVYQIENFFVLPYKDKHRTRCFKNNFHISFTCFTRVFVMNTNNHIPRHVFVPTPLKDIRKHIDQDVYLIGL